MKTITKSQNLIKVLILAVSLFMGLYANAQNCNAAFTYTIGQNGQVNFSSACTNTTAGTQISWSFGQYFSPSWATGTSAVSTNTSSSYSYVCIFATDSLNNNYCSYCDSVILNNNPCVASVSMSLYPDSALALTWNAYAYYDQNVTGATWSWGDGSTTNGLFPTHTYTAAGWYNVCVTETVQCGATASVCNNTFIQKSATPNAMITLKVKNPKASPTGIKSNTKENISTLALFPNPTNANAYLTFNSKKKSEGKISIYDITGSLLIEKTTLLNEGENKVEIECNNLNKGFYIVNLSDGTSKKSMRLIKD